MVLSTTSFSTQRLVLDKEEEVLDDVTVKYISLVDINQVVVGADAVGADADAGDNADADAGDGAAGFFTCPPLHPLASCTVQMIKWLMICPAHSICFCPFQSDTNCIPGAVDHMTISHTTRACW